MDKRRKGATRNQYAHTSDNPNKKDNGGGAGNCQLLLYLRKSVALPCASENAFGQNHLCPQEIGAELEMHASASTEGTTGEMGSQTGFDVCPFNSRRIAYKMKSSCLSEGGLRKTTACLASQARTQTASQNTFAIGKELHKGGVPSIARGSQRLESAAMPSARPCAAVPSKWCRHCDQLSPNLHAIAPLRVQEAHRACKRRAPREAHSPVPPCQARAA